MSLSLVTKSLLRQANACTRIGTRMLYCCQLDCCGPVKSSEKIRAYHQQHDHHNQVDCLCHPLSMFAFQLTELLQSYSYSLDSELSEIHVPSFLTGLYPLTKLDLSNANHKPVMSYLVAEDGRIPSSKVILPLAVKRGKPLEGCDDECKAATDIWIVNADEEDTWEPPNKHTEVLDSVRCKIFEEVIVQASENAKPGNQRKLNPATEVDKLRIRVQDTYMEQLTVQWLYFLSQAIDMGWPSGYGTMACLKFVEAAKYVCQIAAEDDYLLCYPQSARQGPHNPVSGRYAIRTVPTICTEKEYDSELLRDSSEWTEKPYYWGYRQFVPSLAVEMVSKDKVRYGEKIGLMVGEVKHMNESMRGALDHATIEALRGLEYDPTQTAAVVMHPREIYFIHLIVEKGALVRKWKKYNVVKQGIVDHNQYIQFFRDLVLYLSNTYYK